MLYDVFGVVVCCLLLNGFHCALTVIGVVHAGMCCLDVAIWGDGVGL